MNDIRYAIRALGKSRAFTLVAVIALALGIGANTAIFSVVDAVLLRDLPFSEPDRLVMVWEKKTNDRNVVNGVNFFEWRRRNRVFDSLAAFSPFRSAVIGGAEPEQVPSAIVTADFLRALRVQPALGRVFTEEDMQEGNTGKVILSDGLWRRRFGGDPGVLGRTLRLQGGPATIVGVLPPGFEFPRMEPELLAPMNARVFKQDGGRWMLTVARLKPGVTVEQARQEMVSIARQLERERPDFNTGWSANVTPLQEHGVREVKTPLIVLFAAVGLVALIACANVANLVLMRGAGRGRELAVRAALGAGRRRIVRQLMTESLVISAAGAIGGLLLAFWGVKTLLALAPASLPLPKSGDVGIDARVLGFTALISVLTAVLFGLVPALQASRIDLAGSLKQGGRGAAESRRRLRGALVAGEVALAMLLLTGAGLLAKSFVTLVSVDPGFRPERVLTFDLAFSRNLSNEQSAVFLDQALDRLRAVPGVTEAGSIHFLPLTGLNSGTGMVEVGKETARKATWPGGGVSVVTPGYFRAMGIPVLRGRALEPRDAAKTPWVVVVNQAAARAFFGGSDPVGKRMYIQWSDDSRPIEVVGVVGDVRHEGLSEEVQPSVYLPNAQHPMGLAAVVVRTAAEPSAIAGAVKAAVRELDRNQPVANLREMMQIVSDSVSRPRLYSVLLGIFAGLAVTLASVGVYGVLAYSVARRTRDIGVRMALGADPGRVLRSVLKEGMGLAVLGLAAGTLAAAGLTRYLSGMLFGVRPLDAAVFAGAAAVLLAVALVATYVPARRATRVDPLVALRYE